MSHSKGACRRNMASWKEVPTTGHFAPSAHLGLSPLCLSQLSLAGQSVRDFVRMALVRESLVEPVRLADQVCFLSVRAGSLPQCLAPAPSRCSFTSWEWRRRQTRAPRCPRSVTPRTHQQVPVHFPTLRAITKLHTDQPAFPAAARTTRTER